MSGPAMVMADAEGVIRGWSSGAEAFFGHAASAALGEKLDLIVPRDYRARHWRGFHAAVRAGKKDADAVASVPVLRADGTTGRYAVHLSVLTDAFGKGVGAIAVFAEIPAGQGVELYQL